MLVCCRQPVVVRIMVPQRCPHPKLQDLWTREVTWQKGIMVAGWGYWSVDQKRGRPFWIIWCAQSNIWVFKNGQAEKARKTSGEMHLTSSCWPRRANSLQKLAIALSSQPENLRDLYPTTARNWILSATQVSRKRICPSRLQKERQHVDTLTFIQCNPYWTSHLKNCKI